MRGYVRWSVALLFVSFVALAQEDKPLQISVICPDHEECGNPCVESQTWHLVNGTIVGVGRGDVLIVRTYADPSCSGPGCIRAGTVKRVRLPGVRITHPAGKELLGTLVNQDVEVLASESSPRTITGQVRVGRMDVISHLLERGLARFTGGPPYALSSYQACFYRIDEREARAAGVGAWATAKEGSPAGELLPLPDRLVTDAAGVLSEEDVETLEMKLADVEQQGLAEMMIYVSPSLPAGVSLEDFTLRTANEWGVGGLDEDDGLILFLFMAERKVRIEVGRGLESTIPDQAAARIIAEQITPAFRRRAYGEGLKNAVAELTRLLNAGRP